MSNLELETIALEWSHDGVAPGCRKDNRRNCRWGRFGRNGSWGRGGDRAGAARLHAESEVARIEAIFASPDFYEKRGEQTVQLTQELDAAKALVERLYVRWHELEEIKEGNKE